MYPLGKTVKTISADALKIDSVLGYLHFLWLGPFQILFTFVMVYLDIGWHALISLALLLAAVPIQVFLTKLLISNRIVIYIHQHSHLPFHFHSLSATRRTKEFVCYRR